MGDGGSKCENVGLEMGASVVSIVAVARENVKTEVKERQYGL